MNNKTLILGLGNVLMGDEGVGVRSAEYIQTQKIPENTEVLDGGTGGFHLLGLFDEYSKIIMIDATIDGNKPGSVNLIRPKFASDFPKSLTSHDIGLRDLVQSAQALGSLPDIHLITVSIYDLRNVELKLSAKVEESLPEVYKQVIKVLEN